MGKYDILHTVLNEEECDQLSNFNIFHSIHFCYICTFIKKNAIMLQKLQNKPCLKIVNMIKMMLPYHYQDLTAHTKYNCSTCCLIKMQNTHFYNVKWHIRKFLNLPLPLRMASSTAFNHMPYYHCLLRQSNMFCIHNPLQCFYMDVSCCVQKCDFLIVNLKEWYTCIMLCFKLSGGKKNQNRSNAQKFLATMKLEE